MTFLSRFSDFEYLILGTTKQANGKEAVDLLFRISLAPVNFNHTGIVDAQEPVLRHYLSDFFRFAFRFFFQHKEIDGGILGRFCGFEAFHHFATGFTQQC